MGRLTLRLPETLHQQLINLAKAEGVSLNQYIVYALTKQVTPAYAVQAGSEESSLQQKAFAALLKELGQASPTEIDLVLAERERVEPEPDLSPEVIERVQQRIRDRAKAWKNSSSEK